MCDIIIDVPSSLDLRPNILRTLFLGDILRGKAYFHIGLIQRNTEFAHQILYFGPSQPKPFGLQSLSPELQSTLTLFHVSLISSFTFANNIQYGTSS